MLFARDLLLYSALAGTSVSLENRTISVLFPEDSPYCFEVLSVERNAYSLASRAAEYFGEDISVILKMGGREKKCTGGGNGAGEEVEWQNPGPTIPLFRIPREEEPSRDENKSPTPAPPPGRPVLSPAAGSEPEDTEIPFEGLVNEVLKWGGGEVVLVKREDREGDIPEEMVPGRVILPRCYEPFRHSDRSFHKERQQWPDNLFIFTSILNTASSTGPYGATSSPPGPWSTECPPSP